MFHEGMDSLKIVFIHLITNVVNDVSLHTSFSFVRYLILP